MNNNESRRNTHNNKIGIDIVKPQIMITDRRGYDKVGLGGGPTKLIKSRRGGPDLVGMGGGPTTLIKSRRGGKMTIKPIKKKNK
tara:strand:+ start:739 stop:990 length:252 start_codon:yes stop_codon:yes gene_type:complete